MGLREFIGRKFTKSVNDNSEFAVCWDLGIIDNSLLIDGKIKIAYYLQYSRAAIHFTSYINKLNFLKEDVPDNFLEITSSLFDTLICMAKISGLSPKEIPLKKFFELVMFKTKLSIDGKTIKEAVDELSLHEITVFIWHNLIVGEVSTPWFGLSSQTECDWQGIRDNLLVLFSLLTHLCCKLDISFEALCSHHVKRCKRIEDENDD